MRLAVAICLVLFSLTGLNAIAADNEKDTVLQKLLVIQEVKILGNKTTKSPIILRELSFKEGDSLTTFELLNHFETSKRNLTNTSLFNFIDIRYVVLDGINVEVFISVTERWYFWPRPIFELAETNFNSWWENKDFSRINYGLEFIQNNVRGRNERLKLLLQFGFTEMVSLSYSFPYINKKKTLGLKVFGGYGQNHEVNYLSAANKRLFYKDVDQLQQQHVNGGFAFQFRKKFFSRHQIGMEYNGVEVSDSVLFYNPDYLTETGERMEYLTLSYHFVLDKRDNKNYPLEGNYFGFNAIKYGLGVFDSKVDQVWNKVEYKHYWKLFNRTYFATLLQGRFYYSDFQPYYFRDGLNYHDKSTIRSYELYVIDAQQMGIGKFQLRYQLIAPRAYEVGFIPVNKFKKIHYSLYFGIFTDLGYARDAQEYPLNVLANEFQQGYGVSLDLATYYDLVFRAEYSLNKFGEHGLFLHFVAPI